MLTIEDTIQAGLAIGLIAGTLITGELLWKLKLLRGEWSRKFIHMLTASWVASWRFFLPYEVVIAIGLLMVLVIVVAKHFGIFKAIFAVDRSTWGELTFALAVVASAFLFREPIVFFFAILQLGWADGLAALAGKAIASTKYHVTGSTKSVAGSVACFAFAFTSTLVIWPLLATGTGVGHAITTAGLAAISITLAEALGWRGLDNLSIPIVAGLVLMSVV